MKHSSKMTSGLQAWVRQPYRSQPAGRKRGNVEPPITKIQALAACRRSVFGWLFKGRWMDVWVAGQSMAVQSVAGWIANRPAGLTD